MKHGVDSIWEHYEQNLRWAKKALGRMPAYCGIAPKLRGLSGWVFEQVMQFCLREELKRLRSDPEILEQPSIGGRCYNRESFEKYRAAVKNARREGRTFLYFSGDEAYRPHRELASDIFGPMNTFHLDTDRDWSRFVKRVIKCQ